MRTVVYDGSFNGFLTAVFEVYEYKMTEAVIQNADKQQPFVFAAPHIVETNTDKADRIIKGLQLRLTPHGVADVYRAFLSEIKGVEQQLFHYLQKVFASKKIFECSLADQNILAVTNAARKVRKEKHRMEAFVRFELTKDQLYYAIIQPDHNVLPLISKHFKERYADQRWLIYDTTRKYGMYYNLNEVAEVQISFNTNENAAGIYDENETMYQQLWQCYFDSVNIKARKNMKLHIQHMPKRYWKYLTEKKLVS
jgi:probable DNA metabolism protein